jgi:hypothetical protein
MNTLVPILDKMRFKMNTVLFLVNTESSFPTVAPKLLPITLTMKTDILLMLRMKE